MSIFKFRGLGGKGIVTDTPPYDLPPDTWSSGNNIRFENGRLKKLGGNIPTFTKNMPNEIPLTLVQRPTTKSIVYGTYIPNTTRGNLYVIEGRDHKLSNKLNTDGSFVEYEASPSETWKWTILSNVVIFNNKLNNPQGLVPGQPNFQDLPGWGVPNSDGSLTVDWKTPKIVAYKNYLICLGMIEDGVNFSQRLRWSDVTYLSNLPPNWYQDSETNDGGFNDLADSQSEIVDGTLLRDSLIVYTNKDTFIVDYVGGTMVFNFKKLFSDSGIFAPNCCVEFEGKHFVISEQDIFIHNGSTRQSIASSRVKDKLMSDISSVNFLATRVFAYTTKKEIWITYAGPGHTGEDGDVYSCNKVAIWSWQYDTWSFGDLPNVYDMTLAVPPDVDIRTWDGYDPDVEGGSDYKWDSVEIAEDIWNKYSQPFTSNLLIGAGSSGHFYNLDTGFYTYTHTGNNVFTRVPVVAEAQKQSIDMDEQEGNISYHKWWRQIYPQIVGSGTIRFFVGGTNNPYNYPDWDSSYDFVIGEDMKVDCFSNYRYPALKIQDSSEGSWDFGGFDVEYFVEGNR